MRRACLAGLLAGLGGVAMQPGTAAAAQPDATVQRAIALDREGRPADAYALLAPLAGERAGDPDFDYALGLAAADSGHAGEAIVALQRVLSVQPNNSPARAELARAYALGGDIDTARAQFDTVVQDPTLPDPVRQRFDRIVRDYGRQIGGGGTNLSAFADLSGGYDSNVNAATDLRSIVIPLFAGLGPGALGGSARATGKGFYDLQAGASLVGAVSRQTRLFGSLLGGWRDNVNDAAFDQASLTGTGGIAHSLANRDSLSFSGQAQRFWLGHDGYRTSVGAIWQYTKSLPGQSALSIAAQAFRLKYDDDILRDADRYAAAVSYADRQMIVTATAGKEETRRGRGDHLSNRFGSASIGAELPLAPRLNLIAGAALELRRYDDPDPLFLRERKDEQADVSLGIKYLVGSSVYLRPRVTYTRNFSNISLYDYDRWTASLGLRVELQGK